jgi:hypothetical protein
MAMLCWVMRTLWRCIVSRGIGGSAILQAVKSLQVLGTLIFG